jgi:hypothetical protein
MNHHHHRHSEQMIALTIHRILLYTSPSLPHNIQACPYVPPLSPPPSDCLAGVAVCVCAGAVLIPVPRHTTRHSTVTPRSGRWATPPSCPSTPRSGGQHRSRVSGVVHLGGPVGSIGWTDADEPLRAQATRASRISSKSHSTCSGRTASSATLRSKVGTARVDSTHRRILLLASYPYPYALGVLNPRTHEPHHITPLAYPWEAAAALA